jgi:hypothetical protein
MGVRTWWIGLVAAAVISAVTASNAPVVQAQEAPITQTIPAVLAPWSMPYDLPASLADRIVAETPRNAAPDELDGRWSCKLPIRIYYAAPTSGDASSLVKQLEYPVRYLRDLGYTVETLREVAYQIDYKVPTAPGDVLVIAQRSAADLTYMHSLGFVAFAEAPVVSGAITSAKITIDANRGLRSDVLLHELGHVVGLQHKPGTVMAEAASDNDSVALDPAETAAVDCR